MNRDRLINENRGFMGLTTRDAIGIILLFLVVNRVLRGTPYQIVSFLTPIIVMPPLSRIRLRERPKIIRDMLSELLCFGGLYDPKRR
jgi:hypothetical protein